MNLKRDVFPDQPLSTCKKFSEHHKADRILITDSPSRIAIEHRHQEGLNSIGHYKKNPEWRRRMWIFVNKAGNFLMSKYFPCHFGKKIVEF